MYIKDGTLKQTPSAEGAQKRMGDPIWFGRIPAGSLEEVALEPSLKGVEDCCRRDGGRLLWVTKAWEQKKELPFGWEKAGKADWLLLFLPGPGRNLTDPEDNGDGVGPPLREPYLCDHIFR